MKENRLNRTVMDTPYTQMVAISSPKGLAFLEFLKPNRSELLNQRLTKYFPGYDIVEGSDDITAMTAEWLRCYFSREFDGLSAPPLDLRGSSFELSLWQALLRIPLGQTRTYRELAMELGIPRGARAVGGASRRNPVSLIVPCHRVVGHNGRLVGYGGGLEVKQALIAHETLRKGEIGRQILS